MSQVTQEQLEDIEALFVQTAASTTSDGARITLLGMSPSTLYFADRPQREVGHMSTRQFVGSGVKGKTASRRILRTPSSPSPTRVTGRPWTRSW